MIASAAMVLAWSAAPDFARALELARSGSFTEALAAAAGEPDPVRRAQAEFYIRHHAGDLDGALSVARAARTGGLGSAWLAEREFYVAVTVRDTALAREARNAFAAHPADDRAPLLESVETLSTELTLLESTHLARERAERRAHTVVTLGTLALAAGALVLAARGPVARAS